MKKNNTSVDIVAFGDLTDETLSKLRAFNEAVKSNEGSHLEIVPPGPNLLSDTVVASPILAGEGGGAATSGGGAAAGGENGGGNDFEFGVDPNIDPELALVLRMSMEEEKERQEREKKAREEAEGKTNLESVPENKEGEASESQPLLDGNGEPSGSAAAGSSGTAAKKSDKKSDKKDDDKMDTA
jgi:26S proteasome regulatory subunit N10